MKPKGLDYTFTIVDIHGRLQQLRSELLLNGSVVPWKGTEITSAEAKKKVLWYLDRLTAYVAGAEQHIKNFHSDDIFSPHEKQSMEQRILKRLRKKLGMLKPVMRKYSHILRRPFPHLGLLDDSVLYTTETTDTLLEMRRVAQEVINQLELIDSDLDDLRAGLDCSEVPY